MKMIRFTDKSKADEGLRIAVDAAPLSSTGYRGVYEVPNFVAAMLKELSIPFEEVNLAQLERTDEHGE